MPNQYTGINTQPKIKNWPMIILGGFGVLIIIGVLLLFLIQNASQSNTFERTNSERSSSVLDPYLKNYDNYEVVFGSRNNGGGTIVNTGSEQELSNNSGNGGSRSTNQSNVSGQNNLDTRNEARCANISTINNVWDCGYCKGQFISGGPYGAGVCQARADVNQLKYACEGESGLGKPCASGTGVSTSPVGYHCSSLFAGPAYCCREGSDWNGTTCITFCCYDAKTLDTKQKCDSCSGYIGLGVYWNSTTNSCAQLDCSNVSQLTIDTCSSCGQEWVATGGIYGLGYCRTPICGEKRTSLRQIGAALLPPIDSRYGASVYNSQSKYAFNFICGVLTPLPETNVCVEKCAREPETPLVGEFYLGEAVKNSCCPGTELVNGKCRSVCTYGSRISDGCPPASGKQRWSEKKLPGSGASGPGICGTQECANQYIKDLYERGGHDMFWKAVAEGLVPDTEAGLGTVEAYHSNRTYASDEIKVWYSSYWNNVSRDIYNDSFRY